MVGSRAVQMQQPDVSPTRADALLHAKTTTRGTREVDLGRMSPDGALWLDEGGRHLGPFGRQEDKAHFLELGDWPVERDEVLLFKLPDGPGKLYY